MTTFLDLLAVVCLCAFVALIWPPLVLPVVAATALIASRMKENG